MSEGPIIVTGAVAEAFEVLFAPIIGQMFRRITDEIERASQDPNDQRSVRQILQSELEPLVEIAKVFADKINGVDAK